MTLSTAFAAWSIPSPSQGVWYLGPVPLRGYALCIIAGIVAAVWIGERRWVARGGRSGEIQDIAIWAVPFGLVGGRLYHVLTDASLYFGAGQDPVSALYIWRGGLGIWGAIALGAVGAMIGARRQGIRLLPVLDAMAPGVLVAQALGRCGNWFNQELYGRPTTLPWGLEIDPANWPAGAVERLGLVPGTLFQPTFLYEALWNLGAFAVVIVADRRFRLGHGRVLALYVMTYTAGRAWIENLRIDDVELDDVLGLRLNVWTAIVLFVVATAYFVWRGRRHGGTGGGREDAVYRPGRGPEDSPHDASPDGSAASGRAGRSGSGSTAAGGEPGGGTVAGER